MYDKQIKCVNCGKEGKYRCSECHKSCYCSVECQQIHWPIHRMECGIKSQLTKLQERKQKRISNNKQTNTKTSTQVKSMDSFNFYPKIQKLLLSVNKDDNITLESIINEIKNMLILQRKHLIENNIIIDPKESIYLKWSSSIYKIYNNIEAYIYNYVLLIKFLSYETKYKPQIENIFNIITKEIFEGLLSYSLRTIIERCSERFKANAIEPIRYGRLILISHLKLISFFIKLSESLYNHKLFIKYLNYYAMIELLVLSSFFNGDVPHKRLKECSMIKSNLFYSCANSYIKHTYISLGMKIYNQFLYLQKTEDHSFVSHPITINVYHNLGVLNYLIDNVTLSEQIMYNALTLQNKTIKLIGHNENMYKRNKFQLLKLLMFLAEIKIEKDDLEKAVRFLKDAVQIIKELHSMNTANDKHSNKTLLGVDNFFSTKQYSSENAFVDKQNLKTFNKNNTIHTNSDLLGKRHNTIKDNYSFQTINVDDNLSLKRMKTNDVPTTKHLEQKEMSEKLEKMMAIINGLFDKISNLQKEKESKNSLFYVSSTGRNFMSLLPHSRLHRSSVKVGNSLSFSNRKSYQNMHNPNGNEITSTKSGNNPLIISQATNEKIINHLNDEMIKKKQLIDKEYDVADLKNFFIFLTKLSIHQIELLNETQSTSLPMTLYKNLPILFSKQFKNSLNPSQHAFLDTLKVLSLIRCRVLKDVNKPISLDNLRYELFHSSIVFNDLQSKKYNELKDIISKINNNNSSGLIKYQSKHKISINNEDEEYKDEENKVTFKYSKSYNINALKIIIVKKANGSYLEYSQERIDKIINMVNSGLFIEILNCMKLQDIKELENMPEVVITILNERILNEEKQKEDSERETMANNHLFGIETEENEDEEEEEDEEYEGFEEQNVEKERNYNGKIIETIEDERSGNLFETETLKNKKDENSSNNAYNKSIQIKSFHIGRDKDSLNKNKDNLLNKVNYNHKEDDDDEEDEEDDIANHMGLDIEIDDDIENEGNDEQEEEKILHPELLSNMDFKKQEDESFISENENSKNNVNYKEKSGFVFSEEDNGYRDNSNFRQKMKEDNQEEEENEEEEMMDSVINDFIS